MSQNNIEGRENGVIDSLRKRSENPVKTDSTPVNPKDFFSQDVEQLAAALQDRIVTDTTTGQQFRLTEIQAWRKSAVGASNSQSEKRYAPRNYMEPGTLFSVLIPYARSIQSLIVAMDPIEGVGAVVRIVRASMIDPETGQFKKLASEGELAKRLGLKDQQQSKFTINDSGELLLVPSSPVQK